ncbi:heavy-metal-associated domain-containing protein [Oxalobacteraceae bacterium]|nr:heavy-metal-associated domain-containing protein [Oxalobacteraceae bacterium]
MYQLQVENMSCGHCVASVTKAVKTVDAQAEVVVDLPAKQVTVTSTGALAQIRQAIVEAGFPVTSAA